MEIHSGYFGSSSKSATVVFQRFDSFVRFSINASEGCVSRDVLSNCSVRSMSPSGALVFSTAEGGEGGVKLCVVARSGGVTVHQSALAGVRDVCWAYDESAVFFAAIPADKKTSSPNSFEWRGEGLGEGMGTLLPNVYRFDVSCNSSPVAVASLGVSNSFFLTSPCVSANGRLFAVAHTIPASYPAGQKYCVNRPTHIVEINNGNLRELPNTRMFGASKLTSVSEKLLLWVATNEGHLHKSALSIFGMDADATRPLSYADGLDDGDFFVFSENSVYLTLVVRCVRLLSHLNLSSGQLTDVPCESICGHVASCKMLDARDGACLIAMSNQAATSIFSVSSNQEWSCLASSVVTSEVSLSECKVISVDSGSDYIVHRPEEKKSNGALCLFLHGGPHSCVDVASSTFVDMLLQDGFSVISPNFVGSLGQPNPSQLPGQIGTLDMASVAACLAHERARHHYAKVVCVGGSHGGFLAALMQTRPEFSSVVSAYALRNPVIALDALWYVSDIPDWTLVEALNRRVVPSYLDAGLSSGDFDRLRALSPLTHLREHASRAPTLIGLGGKDQRVPASQGKLWYHALTEAGVPVRVFLFPDEDHSLGGPQQQQWLRAVVSHFSAVVAAK